MPQVYDNYDTYERNLRRVQSFSPMTAEVQENFYPCTNYSTINHYAMSTGSFSPSSMEWPQDNSSQMDPMTPSDLCNLIENMDSSNIEKPLWAENVELKILVQPVDKFRFRYKSEMMGTHGSLLGERENSSHKKEVPTVQLINCPEKNAVIRCTLVTADEERRFPHAHHLVRKDGNCDRDDPHDIEVSDENKYTAMFCNMGIIHTAKKDIKQEIFRKQRIEVLEAKKRKDINAVISTREDLEMKTEAEKAPKWMNLNSVALCFQGFIYGPNNLLYPCTDKIYSRPINNLKSALTGELKICRIDKIMGSVDGNEEVWLLVEKVGKKNIRIKFYELDKDTDNVIWEAHGKFSELDVHHQYAIVFKTPPYKDTNVTEPREVYLKLERPSDGEFSNSMKYVYKPSDKVMNRKRPRLSSSFGSSEFEHSTGKSQSAASTSPMDIQTGASETFVDFSNISASSFKLNSTEFKQLFNDDAECEEIKDWDPSVFADILSYYSSNSITTDGPREYEESGKFADNSLQKVIKILKNSETNTQLKQININKIAEILKESTNYGDTPLHYSLRHEQYKTAKDILMILSIDPLLKSISNLQNSTGKTPLHLAVLQNQPDIVQALLKLGADPNICDEEDATSLHNAVIVSANACISALINSGMKLNLEAHTELGWSALHLATKSGTLSTVKMLVNAGADVNSTDMTYGRTALHIAVDNNHKHIVEYLLKETKVDVNMKNFGGNTALHSAVVKGGKCAEELIKILKKYGADPKIRNNYINHEEDEDEENQNLPISQLTIDSCSTQIKSESSSSEEEDEPTGTGESSFDLARNDPQLMELLKEKPAEPMQEELDLKVESEDEISLEERSTIRSQEQQKRHSSGTQSIPVASPSQEQQKRYSSSTQPIPVASPQTFKEEDEPFSDVHIQRISPILNRTGGWERLAHHMNRGSLVRLYKKMSNPSAAYFKKIQLQQPNITVKQVKKYLKDIEAFEAADEL